MAFELTLGKLGVKLVLDDAAFKKGMANVRKSLDGASSHIARGAGLIGAAAVAGVGMAVHEYAKLDQAIMNAAAVSDIGAKAYGRFMNAALEASAGTQYSAVQAGEALQRLSMAGFGNEKAMEALPSVLQLATAGSVELGEAANITTNILSGMSMKGSELARVNDTLVAAFTGSNTSLSGLGQAFKNVASTSVGMGQDIETISAVLGKMADKGIDAATAGTRLRGVMLKMTPTSDKARAAMARLGVSATDASGASKDFIKVIQEFQNATKGMSDANLNKTIKEIFGEESFDPMIALLNEGAESLRKFRDELYLSDGEAKKVADTMRQTLSVQLQMLEGNVQNLAAKFGQVLAPAVSVVNDYLTRQVLAVTTNDDVFEDFRDTMIKVLRTTASFVSATGGVIKILSAVAGAAGTSARGLQMLYKTYELAQAVKERMEAPGVIIAHDRQKTVDRLKRELEELANAGEGTFDWWVEQGEAIARGADEFAGVINKSADAMGEVKRNVFEVNDEYDKFATKMNEASKEGGGLNKTLVEQKHRVDDLHDSLWKLQGILKDFKEGEEDKAVKSASKALKKSLSKKKKEEKSAAKSAKRALDKAVKEKQERDEKLQNFKDAVLSVRQNAVDGMLEMASIVAEAFAGGERSFLAPAMETLSSFAANAGAIVEGASRALAGDMSGAASAADAATSVVKTAVAAFMRYAMSHEEFQASVGVLRDHVAKMNLDALGKFFNSLEGAIGVFLAVPELLAPLGHWGSLMDGVMDDYGRKLFNTIKRVAMAFLNFQVVLSELKLIIFEVGKGILGAYVSMSIKLNETLGRVFKNFNIDWSSAEGKWQDLNRATEDLRGGIDSTREAMERLDGLTYESAKAAAAKAKEEWKAAEGLKELNNELRNAPAGFKRLAKMRFDATAAQGSMEQRGVGLTSSGSVTSTNIAQTIINHFNGMTYEEGAAVVIEQIERRNFVRTGSRSAVAAQRQTQRIRDGIRQAG